MLKIKDNKELKELEKFSFKKLNYCNGTVYKKDIGYKANKNYIVGGDRIIHYNSNCVDNTIDNTLHDLIQAGLVEDEGDINV